MQVRTTNEARLASPWTQISAAPGEVHEVVARTRTGNDPQTVGLAIGLRPSDLESPEQLKSQLGKIAPHFVAHASSDDMAEVWEAVHQIAPTLWDVVDNEAAMTFDLEDDNAAVIGFASTAHELSEALAAHDGWREALATGSLAAQGLDFAIDKLARADTPLAGTAPAVHTICLAAEQAAALTTAVKDLRARSATSKT